MLTVPEDERVISNAQTGVGASRERRAADDHVYRAQRQTLVDVGFFAQRGGGKHLNVELACAALLDFFSRPDRLRVVRLGRFIHVCPLQLGLSAGDTGQARSGCQHSADRNGLDGKSF